jgi:hypothetical protein
MTEHGEFAIEDRGRYIRIELRGSFNVEGARRYIASYRRIVELKAGTAFGVLINSVEYSGLSPDAAQLSDEFNDWLNCVNGFAGKAVVADNQAIVNVSYFLQPATATQIKKVFSDETEAERWLLALIADSES